MSLDIFCEKNGETTVIKASGEMDFNNFSLLKIPVEQALSEGKKNFIMNLSELSYLDSSALGSLLYNQKRIRDRNGNLVLVAGKALMDILSLTHLDSYFSLVDSVDSGRRWFDNKTNIRRIK